ncbi:MAG TPA: sugar ABC transporter ATP-binding protein [Gaiellaceae bacterium]|nr:sugar ABC transporter ATP-binding protein [Gaiellaceae bacterium]
MESELSTPIPAIEGVDVSRSFGGVRALHEASFSADFGEVHALVGENGAGKSTMIKILSGVLRPDAGTIRIRGEDVDFRNPHDARALGVGTVFQELTLMPWMTVAENLFLRHEPRGRTRLIRRRELVDRAHDHFEHLGIQGIDPRELPAALTLAQRQVIEVARALLRDPEILFLDEPTSALAEQEAEWLFGLVRSLRARGTAVIFTSHRWSEVANLADRITIFRNGERVDTRDSLTEGEAVTLMTGRTIDRMYPERPALPVGAETVLDVRDLQGEHVNGVSFALRKGEILGIGGLAGQGQRDLFMTLFGARKSSGGEIRVDGRARRIRKPSDAIKLGLGIALVPEDRKTEGLMLPMSVRDNLTLAVLGRVAVYGVLNPGAEHEHVRRAVERLQIRTTRPTVQEVGTLSGGNQQKVLLGRWLLAQSDVLLFYDITRGVDVGTKHDIYELMMELVREGKSLLFYSSETEEVARLCHRVLVMREGRVAAELKGENTDAEAIVAAAVREFAA